MISAALMAAAPIYATTTYWGGFEDNTGTNADYDYNDMVFSITGASLTLDTATGAWFNQASAGTLNKAAGAHTAAVAPFWNNPSQDGTGGYNVGWCIYGGGACNKGVGLAPADLYLATSTGNSVNDVFFSVDGNVSEQVTLSITAASDALGWEAVGSSTINKFATGVQGPQTFDPGGNFVLVGVVNNNTDYFSNVAAKDGDSHFAFFGASAVPEPSSVALFGIGLIGAGLIYRKRQQA